MQRKHAQTREYMEMNALRAIVKDGAGTTERLIPAGEGIAFPLGTCLIPSPHTAGLPT